jgi:chlorobactene glucosyltransferase
MAAYFSHDLVIHLIIFQMGILVVLLSNLLILRRIRRHVPPLKLPMVSILVPARNEEKNIVLCIRSLLAQDYPEFEVLVLDDDSTDGTRLLLEQMAKSHARLKILSGTPSQGAQLGKTWACVQLTRAAQGDLLFFTDADTFHATQCLRAIVAALSGEQADLLSGFPRQELHTWTERLLVPFFSWAVLCFNPLWLAYRLRLPALSSAVGQVMIFRREALEAIGGYESLGSSIVEDLELAKKIKAAGLRWRMANLTDMITCRMYSERGAAYGGFAKNYFAAFGFRLLPYLFVFAWLAVMFWEPLIILALFLLGLAPQARLIELLACIGLSLLVWLIPYPAMRLPSGLGLFYPLTILANEVVAFRSLRLSLAGRLTWKGRRLPRPKWKWL